MMKTTQFLTNIKLWQGIFFSFLLLVSLNLNSQNVGDDLLANSNGMVDTTSGATGSGGGCFSTGNNGSPGGTYDGSTECGWTSAAGLNYAPANNSHGPTHSGDRMFKSYKTNGSAGEFIAQEVGELALGTYTYSFFHRWTGGSIDYTEGAPKFTIKEQNADGGWDNVLVVDLVEGNTGASGEWTETTGTWVNENVNNYKIQVYKNGAANAGLAQNLHLDSFSFVYTEAASSGGVTAPWTDDFEDGDNSDWTILTAADASQGWVLANGTNGSIVMYHGDDNVSSGVDNYLASPVIDMSGLTSPLLSYSERGSYASYYTFHGVYTSSDYTGDVAAATWTLLTEGVAPGTEAVQEFSIPNTTTGIAFRYQGDYSDTWEIDNVSVTETPTEPSMEVSASTDGGSATFSFDVENFTVGAAGDTGVDGHIHYSLNGGSTVMVYSADDLTLSDLPNGDHTIVFELVDDAHASLDPAVTATVEFSTFDGTAECGDTYTYTQVNSNTFTLSVTAPEGQNVSVTVNGQLETNYDSMTITDSTGNVIADAVDGTFADSVFEADGTMNITVSNDSSVNYGDIVFAFSCAASTANVTFTVNMSNYIGGLAEGDIVYLNGDFYADSAWCGDCNPMTDNGDGTWSITLPIEAGTYDYKFTVNGWNNQEMWPGDGALSCPENTDDGQFENRSFTVADEDLTLETVFWNLCVGEEPAETFTVTFEVNTSSIVGGVGANGLYAGGGVLGNAQAVALSDDDGDGIWVGSIDLPAGSTGNYIFLNSPGDGGDWGAKENLEGQDCADPANFNDRILPEVTADVTYLACYGECSGDGTGECPAIGTTYMLTMTVNTANITVGENGMFVGGGVFGGSNGQAMSDDDGDGTWEVTVEVEEGFSGNYAFFNSPNGSSDWDTKENLEGQACADPANFNDRILEAVTADTTLMHCFGSCETDGSCPEGDPAMMLQGIIDFTVPSGGSDGKAIHLYVNEDIADLAQYGIGVANNGGGTDGQEYTFPTAAPTAGQHILVVRSVEAMDAYMNASAIFDHVFVDEGGSISQNGDDAIELYFLGGVVEVFGDIDVDGTGEAWEYLDSWAYKVNGDWTYGGVNCTDDSTTSCESSCPYPFAECSAGPCPAPDITSWSMTGDGAIFGGNNQDGVIGYQIEYSTSTFTPGDGTATIYEFDSFPHTLTGLESNTTYYFTIRSVCGDDNYSDWSDNGNDGPDAWTTTTCPSSYSLPYLNDFNDPVAWTTCQTFYDNDGDGNYWFYTTIDNSDNLTASSFSWNGSAFTPDNWVIMGPIDLTNVSDALLEWEVQALDPAYCNENYSVYVGPSNNYSDLLGSSVSYTETLESGGDACGSWANRSLDISAATGDLVYIGLRHHDVTDVYILSIDNVSVTSSTMSNEDFTLQNIDYSFDQETNLLRVTSEVMLSNIQIYNMLGQEVLSQDLNETSALLNLSSLSSSIYIVNVEGNNSKTKTFKLAIK